MPCVSSRNIAEVTILMFDTHGKRDADLNLKSVVGELKFRALLEEADVLLDWYSPGLLEQLGFGREMVHEIARRQGKGIVYERENTSGWEGSGPVVVGISRLVTVEVLGCWFARDVTDGHQGDED